MNHSEIINCIKSLWDYLTIRDEPKNSDAIFVFGREDFNIAEKAFQLYRADWAPNLILLGGHGRLSGGLKVPESEAFKTYLLERGIPEEVMLTESVSTNTGENVDGGLKLIEAAGIYAKRIILITHGPHAKRTLAAAQKRSMDIEFISCPDDCALPAIDSPDIIVAAKELAGEIKRIVEYGSKGFLVEQNIPQEILHCASIVEERIASFIQS